MLNSDTRRTVTGGTIRVCHVGVPGCDEEHRPVRRLARLETGQSHGMDQSKSDWVQSGSSQPVCISRVSSPSQSESLCFRSNRSLPGLILHVSTLTSLISATSLSTPKSLTSSSPWPNPPTPVCGGWQRVAYLGYIATARISLLVMTYIYFAIRVFYSM